MTREEYEQVLRDLQDLGTCEEKKEFLDDVIFSSGQDSSGNGLVDDLIDLRNSLPC